jgi:hypothetical protein
MPINGPAETASRCRATAQDPAAFALAPSREADPVDLGRRVLLGTVLAASATALVPSAFAAPADDTAHDAFVGVSKILTGRTSLDPTQASRLYEALINDDPQFATGLQALVTLIDQRNIDPLQLQHLLDSEKSPVAALPRKIATAWYIGVVGDGEKARCITFETNLTNVVVSDGRFSVPIPDWILRSYFASKVPSGRCHRREHAGFPQRLTGSRPSRSDRERGR